MRTPLILGLILFTVCFGVQAQIEVVDSQPAKPPSANSVCRLLTSADIGTIGYNINNSPRDNEVSMPVEMSGAPAAIQTELCFYYADVENSRKSVSLAIDHFEKMDGIVAWLKMKNDQAKTATTVVTELGDTTCEEGDYPFTVSKTAPRSKEMTQFYVACDRLVNDRRVSLSVEIPTDRSGLPSPAQTKALLDLAIGRLGVAKN
ncbi:MAG: hypothetical protein IPP41_06310 [Rhodocyclaceae bacterium]|nr:hypothetical protein [Rhodocyclaceae bacterium]